MATNHEIRIKSKENQILSKDDCTVLIKADLDWLTQAANELRQHHQGNHFDLCTIINGKSGCCPEDCRYCAQSSHYATDAPVFPLLSPDEIVEDAKQQEAKGILRYSIVTSGKRLTDEEINSLCIAYKRIKDETSLSLCASHGLLTKDQFIKLREAGVSRYHNNLETSNSYFSSICTTHRYEDKITVIQAAQKAGLSVCSGGIFGMGESWQDRIDMLMDLRRLDVDSIPINFFCPIAGTPLGHHPILDSQDALRIIAIARFIHPTAAIRLAGGRGQFTDQGRQAFQSGANSAITGDLLTTAGISVKHDQFIINKLGYTLHKL